MTRAALSFPPLPIDDVLPELLHVLEAGTNAVLVAEPGAGKTTRVPLALLQACWRSGKIIVLVPRRVAARAAAQQMSRLLKEEVGQTVGYRVRLDSRISGGTLIELVTEGVFTRMILDDPSLEDVSAVIFDEFHERSLEGDLALALALDAQAGLRADMRLLVMSATLDAGQVSALLENAPQISSKGRSFPVETRYLPSRPGERVEEAVAHAVLKALREEGGSILAFLPGAGEIERAVSFLEGKIGENILLAPLYGAQELKDQDRAIALAPDGRRKVVLATAIAETSLTIEGVRIVVDSGFARVPRYNPESGLSRLETVRVSQASAEQRRGRAGRLEPGLCYRLWSEGQTRALLPFNRPEILEADLSGLVLSCAAFGVADPRSLRFLDPPSEAALSEAKNLLRQLEAIDAEGRITPTGRLMTAAPLPPRLAHMLIAAQTRKAGVMAAELAAILTERGLGGSSADIEVRLSKAKSEGSARAQKALAQARRWVTDKDGPVPSSAGELLALAYPDRIALKREGTDGEFLLSSGQGVYMDKTESLAKRPCLVVAEAQGAQNRARILLAAAYDKEKIALQFPHLVTAQDECFFDTEQQKVRRRKLTRFGALILSEQNLPPAGEEAQQALMQGIRQTGFDRLVSEHFTQTLLRYAFLRRHAHADWPEVNLEILEQSLEEWLMPFLPGARSFADLTPEILQSALEALFTSEQRQKLKQDAPARFTAPTGETFAIDYADGAAPRVSLRVQQVFGLKTHPFLAGGKVPLSLELLSPAHRPIQLTRDLPQFWKGSWSEVRREMRGRYPKHDWPEDPAKAKPTSRAKPRG